MRINTPKLTNIVASDDITAYLMKKLRRIEKLMHHDESALLDMEFAKISEHHQSGNIYRAEFNLSARANQFRSERQAPELKAAIDMAVDELVESVRSSKDRRTHVFRRGGLKVKNMLKGLIEWRPGRWRK